MEELTRRHWFQRSLAASAGACAGLGFSNVSAQNQAIPIPAGNTVRDRLWIFTVVAGMNDDYLGMGGVYGGSRMTPAEGAFIPGRSQPDHGPRKQPCLYAPATRNGGPRPRMSSTPLRFARSSALSGPLLAVAVERKGMNCRRSSISLRSSTTSPESTLTISSKKTAPES